MFDLKKTMLGMLKTFLGLVGFLLLISTVVGVATNNFTLLQLGLMSGVCIAALAGFFALRSKERKDAVKTLCCRKCGERLLTTESKFCDKCGTKITLEEQ